VAEAYYETVKRLPNPDGRFGRNVAHDSRSRAYRPRQIETPQDVDWDIALPILDQEEGSCVLQTVAQLAAFIDHWRTIPLEKQRAILLDPQVFIRDWYRWTTRRDPFTGEWEPNDTGTDGNTGAKCAVNFGYAKGYVHAFGLEEGFTLLNHAPIGVGGVWMSSFDRPDFEGIIRWASNAYVRGGHEWIAVGHDTARGLVKARQTWGLGYGKQGIFYVPDEVLDRILRDDGDIIQLVPLDQPAPEPDWDQVLAKPLRDWAYSRTVWSRFTKAGKAAAASREWLTRKGL
jgi:hypothetical protein